jgi:FemAB-related protein (PEP-CTERM system-associated)
MHIRLATPADQHAWDGYVLAHPEGTAYQLWAWREAVESAYGFAGIYLLAEAAGQVRGVLPLVDFRVPLRGASLVSLPYCDVGGVLADDAEVAGLLLAEARTLGRERNSPCMLRSVTPLAGAGVNRTDKVRMVLDLPGGSDVLLAGLKAKLRSQVNKPLRDGLTVRLGGAELGASFYEIFAENMRDLGSPVHSRGWIEAVLAAYGERARVAMVATPAGEPAAAGIILLHPTTVSIPWASALRRHNRLNPNMLLYWSFLSFAADHGYKRFDFGRSTPGEGTYRFKEQWGTRPQPLFWYELTTAEAVAEPLATSRAANPLASGGRDLAARIWSRLPLAGANWLGPRIRKYIAL